MQLPMSRADFDRLNDALFPYLRRKQRRVLKRSLRFVHYTTAAAAESIISGRSVWMRSTTCMNDFSEVEHGMACFDKAWDGKSGRALRGALDSVFPKISEDMDGLFKKYRLTILKGSFIACFSEHSHRENEHGRLSMWRAYGTSHPSCCTGPVRNSGKTNRDSARLEQLAGCGRAISAVMGVS